MIQVVFVLLALLAGAAATVQFAVNAELRGAVGGPILAAALSFLVGTVTLSPLSYSAGKRYRPSRPWRGAVVGVGRRVSRGALRDGFDNPHPEARGGKHRVLHPGRPDLCLELA